MALYTAGIVDDRELIERCVKRAGGAWEEFLSRYRPVLERAAAASLARVLGSASADDVEAVIEAALVRIVQDDYAALRGFGGRSSLAGYLRAIATHVALNHVRGERRKGWLRFRPLEAAPERSTEESSAFEEVEASEARVAELRRALDRLPSRDRLILKLFHLDGASYKEIGRVLDMPVNAVSPTLSRAREKLRVLMEPER